MNLSAQTASLNVIDDNLFRAQTVFPADIDGDGDIDVIATSTTDSKVVWYNNLDGLGSFSSEIIITTEVMGVASLQIVDVDGDTDLDIVAVSDTDGEIVWLENLDGQANFGSKQLISCFMDLLYVAIKHTRKYIRSSSNTVTQKSNVEPIET